MNKLRKKLFYTIFSILTLSVLSFIVIFNIQNYIEQKNRIDNSLNMATGNKQPHNYEEPPMKPNNYQNEIDENIKFMDFTIYTVLLEQNDEIKDIINHSNNQLSNDNIKEIAIKILNSKKEEKHIGFLYIDDYSYYYNSANSLVILDNNNVKSSLILSLEVSILLFILLEIIIFVISKLITNWIIKPVLESFLKQKTFIADASHELKTPLSVIIASSEALEDSGEKKWLNNIKNEANRMNLLITNLLELAATENVETFKFEEVNLSKIIELSVLTFEGKAFENNIKLNYDINDNIILRVDESSMKQLVEILLDNAIKHSYKNETINISLKETNNNIELLVQNKGDEIPKDEEEKIFERFYRIDKSRNRKENRYGLGLAIAKNIVVNHNGKISASSLNNITTFKVLLKK